MLDRLNEAIFDALASHQTRAAPSGWVQFCCVMCVSRGETPDKRYRCGVLSLGSLTLVKCFNCGFRTGWQIGQYLGRPMKDFLRALGISDRQISLLTLWTEQIRRQICDDPDLQQKLDIAHAPNFPAVSLPPGARLLEDLAEEQCNDANLLAVIAYVLSRGDVAASASKYYWTPRNNLQRHLIIPCYHDDRIVGWIARAVDRKGARYLKEVPPNFLFNAQYLAGSRHYAFIVEGAFDALVIDGVAGLGASLNERQIAWINRSGKQPIVVPDRDQAGRRLVDLAVAQGWSVAMPCVGRRQWWDTDIKDAAEAVQRYGKLYVVQSVLATQECDPAKIELSLKYLAK